MVAGHPAYRRAGDPAVTTTKYCHAPDGTFRKILPRDQARRELADRRMVAELIPVPRLAGIQQVVDGCDIARTPFGAL
jgi:hypothetical protein